MVESLERSKSLSHAVFVGRFDASDIQYDFLQRLATQRRSKKVSRIDGAGQHSLDWARQKIRKVNEYQGFKVGQGGFSTEMLRGQRGYRGCSYYGKVIENSNMYLTSSPEFSGTGEGS